jgi:hypothetical protein
MSSSTELANIMKCFRSAPYVYSYNPVWLYFIVLLKSLLRAILVFCEGGPQTYISVNFDVGNVQNDIGIAL